MKSDKIEKTVPENSGITESESMTIEVSDASVAAVTTECIKTGLELSGGHFLTGTVSNSGNEINMDSFIKPINTKTILCKIRAFYARFPLVFAPVRISLSDRTQTGARAFKKYLKYS